MEYVYYVGVFYMDIMYIKIGCSTVCLHAGCPLHYTSCMIPLSTLILEVSFQLDQYKLNGNSCHLRSHCPFYRCDSSQDSHCSPLVLGSGIRSLLIPSLLACTCPYLLKLLQRELVAVFVYDSNSLRSFWVTETLGY